MLAYLKDLPRKVHYEAISSTIRLDGRTDLYSVGLVLLSNTNKEIMAGGKGFTQPNKRPYTPEIGRNHKGAIRGKRI